MNFNKVRFLKKTLKGIKRKENLKGTRVKYYLLDKYYLKVSKNLKDIISKHSHAHPKGECSLFVDVALTHRGSTNSNHRKPRYCFLSK